MVQIIASVLGLFAAMLLLRSLWIRSGLTVRQTVVTLVAVAIVLALGLLAATGRLNWVVPILAAALPFLAGATRALRARIARALFPGGATPHGQPTSSAEAAFLTMTLDHATGQMDGEVRKGRHAGRRLSSLSVTELAALAGEIDDSDSQRLLESYLDRTHPSWRESTRDAEANPPMTREAALEILGLAPGATREEIVAAHRRLIQRLHPDRGGSTFLAAQINGAKKVLIG